MRALAMYPNLMLARPSASARSARWYSVEDLHNDNTNCMATNELHKRGEGLKTPEKCMEIIMSEASNSQILRGFSTIFPRTRSQMLVVVEPKLLFATDAHL